MSENSKGHNIDIYYDMARQTAGMMPQDIKKFFNYATSDVKLSEYLREQIADWAMKEACQSGKYDNSLSLVNVLWYINTSTLDEDLSVFLRVLSKQRRNKHDYFLRSDEAEYAKKTGFYKTAILDMAKVRMLSSDFDESAPKDFATEIHERVKAWAMDPMYSLVGYPFTAYLSPKKQMENLMLDLKFRLFDLIVNSFNKNRIDGYKIKFPKQFIETGVFGGNTKEKKADIEYTVSRDAVIAKARDVIERGNGERVETSFVAGSVLGEFDDALSDEEKGRLVESLRSNGLLNIYDSMLDAKDREVFIAVYNSFSIEDIISGAKVFPLSEIANNIGMDHSRKSYGLIMRRLDKLMRYRLDYQFKDKNGKSYEYGSTVLISRIGWIDGNVPGSPEQKAGGIGAEMKDNSAPPEYLDSLEQKDLKNVSVVIEPAPFLRNLMKKAVNVSILTSMYKSIAAKKGVDPDRIRSVMVLLQSRRMDILPEKMGVMTYQYFSQHLKLQGLRPAKLKSWLKEPFDYMVKNEMILKSYDFTVTGVRVEFYPIEGSESVLIVDEPD